MNKAFESTEVKFVTKEINRVNKPDYFHNVAPYKQVAFPLGHISSSPILSVRGTSR